MDNNNQEALLSSNDVPESIFRAYDIRGIYDKTLTADIVYKIGLALGSEAKTRGHQSFITARDARYSSPILSIALQQGLLATGVDVIDIGAVATPMLYFATKVLPVNSGVMITGSHNPSDYNGLKIVLGGKTLTENEIKRLYQRIIHNDFVYGAGSIENQNIMDQYIERIAAEIQIAKPMKIVVDCANGIAGIIAPNLLRKLGIEVIELFCDLDGYFSNHPPDPSQPENFAALINEVKKHNADLGIMFDGDADRLGVVTNQGEIIWPDRQIMLFAKHVLLHNPGGQIIYDVKCTKHLQSVIRQFNGIPLMWKTGHSLIKAKMFEIGALMAGEMSGHIFFNDRWYGFDDGIYASTRLLEILSQDSRDVAAIFAEFPDSVNTPELRLDLPEEEKFSFMNKFLDQANFDNAEISTIDGLRVDFAKGWGLIRPSNTTPCLILRFEADSEVALSEIQQLFRQQILAIDESVTLPF